MPPVLPAMSSLPPRTPLRVRSVAVIGAGACGAIAAAALREEGAFDKIRVFERRSEIGGVWRYDPFPTPHTVFSGDTETTLDPPLAIPSVLPAVTPASKQDRWEHTATYATLLSNIPASGMSFSDAPVSYSWPPAAAATDPLFDRYKHYFGPYTAVWEYVASYFSRAPKEELVLNTTLEELSKEGEQWRLVLRRREGDVDHWWEERFDAVVLANGRYYVPYIPAVPGLREFQEKRPGVVEHSKYYRAASDYLGKKVLVVGNRPSGFDLVRQLLLAGCTPIYQSKRTHYATESPTPPPGIIWKPPIASISPSGTITFSDNTTLEGVDKILYTTGYRLSLPFLARALPHISTGNRIVGSYLHTFYRPDPTLAFVGSVTDGVSFRGFEHQAVAAARVLSGRAVLPAEKEMVAWEEARLREKGDSRGFHTIGTTNAEAFWEELRRVGGEGEGGRRWPERWRKEEWKAFEEAYRWRVGRCEVPEVGGGVGVVLE